jgi:hypothetical protein
MPPAPVYNLLCEPLSDRKNREVRNRPGTGVSGGNSGFLPAFVAVFLMVRKNGIFYCAETGGCDGDVVD